MSNAQYHSSANRITKTPNPLTLGSVKEFFFSRGLPASLQAAAGRSITLILFLLALFIVLPATLYLRFTQGYTGLGGYNLSIVMSLIMMTIALIIPQHAVARLVLTTGLFAGAVTPVLAHNDIYQGLLITDFMGVVAVLFFGFFRGGGLYLLGLAINSLLGHEPGQDLAFYLLVAAVNVLITIQFAYVVWLGALAVDNEIQEAERIGETAAETLKAQQDLLRFLTVETRPPLTALLALTADPDATQDQDLILTQIDQLGLLAEDLKSVYGTENAAIHNANANFANVFDSVIELLGPMLTHRRISFTCGQPKHLTSHYHVESVRVRSILLSLMRLGIFVEQTRFAELRASVELSSSDANPVVVRMTLSGPAMPIDEVENCLGQEAPPSYPLSMVWQELRWIRLWLQELGGSFGLETSKNGTSDDSLSFRVTIPLVTKALLEPNTPHNTPHNTSHNTSHNKGEWLKNQKVLVIDDDPVMRRATAVLLYSRFGANVEQASSVDEAIKKLDKTGPFKAVITDYIMPGRSGADLLNSDFFSKRNIPIIVLTASITPSELASLQQAGAVSIVSKPPSEQKFTQVFNELFGEELIGTQDPEEATPNG